MANTNTVSNKENTSTLGKFWAAVKDDKAIAVVSMKVPNDVDFDAYRDKTKDALSLLGDVRSGELFRINGAYVFVQRLTHSNRSKKDTPRIPKQYIVTSMRDENVQ